MGSFLTPASFFSGARHHEAERLRALPGDEVGEAGGWWRRWTGGWGLFGQGAFDQHKGDFKPIQKPLRPEAFCFVTSLQEHNANANEEEPEEEMRWDPFVDI